MAKADKKEKVYSLLMRIPKGKVTTYKALASVCGISPREVGRILSKNPSPITVPCHRVVRADGSVGGYTWRGKIDTKKKILLLRAEGLEITNNKNNKIINFSSKIFKP